jgi:uncharacterized protein YqhQ
MSDDEKPDDQKLRLGGMALRNGLALFGPTSWAAAVRTPDGGIRVESGRRPRMRFADRVPFMRGVVRMSEMLAALPLIRRRLPEARLSFENGGVAASTLFCAALATVVKRRGGFRSEVAATVIGIVPSFVTLRNRELVRYHGAEHKTVAGYEGDLAAAATSKEHERCGTHLVAPMLLGAVGAAGIAARSPRALRRPVGALGSLAAVGFAFELFAWRERHPDSLGARALGTPGTAIQRALATAEPGEDELEVAERALAALLAAEDTGATV